MPIGLQMRLLNDKKKEFYFKSTTKDIIKTKEDKEDFVNNNICRLCEKEIIDNQVRDHCRLTGKNRGPAHSKCKINVEQSQSNFVSVILINFSNYDCHLFFKKIVDLKKDKVEFKIIHETNEEYISIRYGCVRFIDSYRILSSGLDKLVETFVDNSHKSLENFKKGIIGDNNILTLIVIEMEKLLNKDGKHKASKNLRKDYPDKTKELEEALLNDM